MYYHKVNDEILLTEEGHYILSYFGLTVEDLRRMSKEDLQKHIKTFDVLNDGKITKNYRPNSDGNRYGENRNLYGKYKGGHIFNAPHDSGSYSRYFSIDSWAKTFPFLICPKASKSERNKGCESLPKKPVGYNNENWSNLGIFDNKYTVESGNPSNRGIVHDTQNFHPTVKPLKLMSYLITLGSREGDLVLDPFVGSGTVCIAAETLNRKYVGIEINQEYYKIAQARLSPYLEQTRLL